MMLLVFENFKLASFVKIFIHSNCFLSIVNAFIVFVSPSQRAKQREKSSVTKKRSMKSLIMFSISMPGFSLRIVVAGE